MKNALLILLGAIASFTGVVLGDVVNERDCVRENGGEPCVRTSNWKPKELGD